MTPAILSCCAARHEPGFSRPVRPARSYAVEAAILYCDAIIDSGRALGVSWAPMGRPSIPGRRERFRAARERLVAYREGSR